MAGKMSSSTGAIVFFSRILDVIVSSKLCNLIKTISEGKGFVSWYSRDVRTGILQLHDEILEVFRLTQGEEWGTVNKIVSVAEVY